jgi:hypothetical protein
MEAAVRLQLPNMDKHAYRAKLAIEGCERAYRAYRAGAAGAFIDLVAFIHTYDLPMPTGVAADCGRYTSMAFSGGGEVLGRRLPTPAAVHRAALIKRLRYEHVNKCLRDAYFLEYIQNLLNPPALGGSNTLIQGQEAQVIINWGSASKIIKVAAASAEHELPEVAGARNVTVDTICRNFREVSEARASGAWPMGFYLPSEATCRIFEWQDLTLAFQNLHVMSDAPWLCRLEKLRTAASPKKTDSIYPY